MKLIAWSTRRRASVAARKLRQASILIDGIAQQLTARDAESATVATANLVEARERVRRSRALIEEFATLSYTLQSRFFRLFERVEECVDYAIEAIHYGEFAAARIDLERTLRGLDTAVHLLEESATVSHIPSRLERVVDVLTLKMSRPKVRAEDAWELDIRPLVASGQDSTSRQALLL